MKHNLLTFSVALSFFMACVIGANADNSDYPIVVGENQNYTHNSRRLNSVSLNSPADGAQTISLPTPLKVYSKVDTPAFSVCAGETVTATFGFSGTWMNGFVYIDRGQDGAFEATLNSNGTIPAGSDIMAFSYAEPTLGGTGYNSTGATVSNADVLNPPSFKIPADLANGFYRMRFKVDWASIDPAGRPEDGNGILKNGGAICDVRLNVHGENVTVNANGDNGSLTTSDGAALKNYKHSFGRSLKVKIVPSSGYMCDAIALRHGHNLNGAASVHGVAQYENVTIPGVLISGDTYEIPAEYMDGDVEITATFVKMADGVTDGKDYALSFDKNAESTAAQKSISKVGFTVSKGQNGALTIADDVKSVYSNADDFELAVTPGATVNAKVNSPSQALNYYLYVDMNNDGMFAPLFNADGTLAQSSELLSYTSLNGKNSDGGAAVTNGELPSFKVSELLPYGIYRARIKADIENADPAGSSEITAKGGMIVDFLLNVYNEECRLKLDSYNGAIYSVGNSALPMTVNAFEAFRICAVPVAEGYNLEELRVRHGYNLDGPQYVQGNRQWSEEVYSDEIVFLPNESVCGDMIIYANFVAGPDAEYHLVFSDEFNTEDGSQPNSKWWSRCQRQGATWNRWLSDREEVIYIEDGNLVARAVPNPDTTTDNVPMITGGIWSRDKFGFTYGLVEGRIKANPWTGNFPAFWMMPEDQSGGWPNDGEIDIWETIDSQERSWHTVHTNWTYNMKQTSSPQSSFNVATSLDRYHIFSIEWDETSIAWFVDGNLVGTYYKSSDSYALNNGQWPFDDNFHLILNQSVGNNSWAANADVTHTYETLFDWVRVYQKKGMQNTSVADAVETSKENVTVAPIEGGVSVTTENEQDIAIYDAVGRKVANVLVNGTKNVALDSGFYVVCGNKLFVE
ncbi:MAG: glycoside hydrolase family 16 protein [Bacteroidaceae bacterium]|nr:glycoside hydrolase family 16 protein [Bacteroidaceae bacterium]